MKKYTIFAPGIDSVQAVNMTFVLFDNFTIGRSFGLIGGVQRKFIVVTIFANVEAAGKVADLRDKFAALSGETTTAVVEDITILSIVPNPGRDR